MLSRVLKWPLVFPYCDGRHFYYCYYLVVFSLSAAGLITRLLLTKWALLGIVAAYLVRGLLGGVAVSRVNLPYFIELRGQCGSVLSSLLSLVLPVVYRFISGIVKIELSLIFYSLRCSFFKNGLLYYLFFLEALVSYIQ